MPPTTILNYQILLLLKLVTELFQSQRCCTGIKTVFIWLFLPMTANVPSRMPTADWIVGMPSSCLAAILQFPLTLQGHTVTNRENKQTFQKSHNRVALTKQGNTTEGDKLCYVHWGSANKEGIKVLSTWLSKISWCTSSSLLQNCKQGTPKQHLHQTPNVSS